MLKINQNLKKNNIFLNRYTTYFGNVKDDIDVK